MKDLSKTLLLMFLAATSASIAAAPTGYSINSDSASGNADSLYRIDLATGVETRIGTVTSLGQTRIDVEGLAFAPDGTLYGVDDASMTLFPINPDNGVALTANEVDLGPELPRGGGNDFGMTFACDGNLYISSVIKQTLYRLALDGTLERIGDADGKLGANISALAAYGSPTRLYGLGNGLTGELTEDSPYLHEIDLSTGVATRKPNKIGPNNYSEGGLAFDDAGTLWAITDRRQLGAPSQVMKLDLTTGEASAIKAVNATGEQGFESLAISVPRGCGASDPDALARFKVQKQFLDGNNITPVTLNIECNSGLPLRQSIVVQPDEAPLGEFEVEFVVDSFRDGELDCEISEEVPTGYTPSYQCFSEGECSDTAEACTFSAVQGGQENLCLVRNHPEAVEITVSKEWAILGEQTAIDESAVIELHCENLFDGDGEFQQDGSMLWRWDVSSGNSSHTATVYPLFDGSTRCRSDEQVASSAVESANDCASAKTILPGQGTEHCTIINSVFFEGIPTLDRFGLVLIAGVLLLTGLFSIRRL
ncbi:MAG: hypothetical protein RQ826_10075 [Xanthomonadales bacterium]|nr:hypothetical protein [Xanthomonadales bacterium]